MAEQISNYFICKAVAEGNNNLNRFEDITPLKLDDRIELATKWLRIFSISPNDKIRNHLVANSIFSMKCKNL